MVILLVIGHNNQQIRQAPLPSWVNLFSETLKEAADIAEPKEIEGKQDPGPEWYQQQTKNHIKALEGILLKHGHLSPESIKQISQVLTVLVDGSIQDHPDAAAFLDCYIHTCVNNTNFVKDSETVRGVQKSYKDADQNIGHHVSDAAVTLPYNKPDFQYDGVLSATEIDLLASEFPVARNIVEDILRDHIPVDSPLYPSLHPHH